MKIAFWSSGYFSGFGGAEVSVAELINTLARRGEDCWLLASVPTPGESSVITPPLDPRVRVWTGAFDNPMRYLSRPLALVSSFARYLASAVSLLTWLLKNRPDVVHQHFVSVDVLMLALFRRLAGYRLVVTFHGMEIEMGSRSKLTRWKNRVALSHADHVTTVSPRQCRLLREIAPNRPVHRIPNALEPASIRKLAAAPADIAFTPDQFIYCGRVDVEKRVPELVEAFGHAVRHGCSRNLYVLGDGEDDARVREAIANCGLSQRVIPLGARERAQALHLIGASYCLLLNSDHEGYPMVVLEGMILGKPIIAPEVGGIGEMLVDGETALLFPVGDAEALSAAILALDSDPSRTRAMGLRCRDAVSRLPDLDSVVGQYLDLYADSKSAVAPWRE